MSVNPFVRNLIAGSILFVAGALAAAAVYLSQNGRALVLSHLETLAGRAVRVERIHPIFPLGVEFIGFEVDGRLRSKSVTVLIDPVALLRGKVLVTGMDLYQPQINVDSHTPVPAGTTGEGAAGEGPVKKNGIGFFLQTIRVHDGILMIQAPSAGKTWVVESLNVELRDFLPEKGSGRVTFVLNGSLARMDIPFLGHLMKAEGWVNWPVRDLEARLQTVDEDGRAGLDAALAARANVLTVSGKGRVSPDQTEQSSRKKPRLLEGAVLDVLRATGSDVDVEFSFTAKLDDPMPEQIKIQGMLTTELQSEELSSNIVGNLKAVGAKLLKEDSSAPAVVPVK